MAKKKKNKISAYNRKRNLLAHIQYFYGLFFFLAVGAVIFGFSQPTSSSQVLGARDWGSDVAQTSQQEVPFTIADFGEALWYSVKNLVPFS